MLIIDKNNNITLAKGEYAELDLRLLVNDKEFYIEPTDKIDLSVAKFEGGPKVIHIFNDSESQNSLFIYPEDTINLKSGQYLFNMNLENEYGEVYNIVPTARFNINERI